MTTLINLSFIVDGNLQIRSWNEDMKTFTGLDSSVVIGKKYTELFPQFLIDQKDAVEETFHRREPVSLKHLRFHCLSHYQKADIHISPMKNGLNTFENVQIDLHPSEPCMIGRQWIDAQKLMAIGKIAATLAHGVRNPLNAIKGAVVYLRDRYAHEKPLVEFTEILEEEISRLENFISRFLSTTTFDSDIAITDINQLIQKIKVFVSLQTGTRGIRCEYVLGDIPTIETSGFHLEHAILNVINNSIEAMKSGGKLTIRTYLSAVPPQQFIAIEISDTGSGIELPTVPSNIVQHNPGNGRGFGLFIAQEIIKYYNGHLKITRNKGKGTTVAFLLPVKDRKEGIHHG